MFVVISLVQSHKSMGVNLVVFLEQLKRHVVMCWELPLGQFGGTFGSIFLDRCLWVLIGKWCFWWREGGILQRRRHRGFEKKIFCRRCIGNYLLGLFSVQLF